MGDRCCADVFAARAARVTWGHGKRARALFCLLFKEHRVAFTLSSPAFPPDGPVSAEFTCDGGGVSPPLAWTDAPDGTRSFVLVMHDPDAPDGELTHWILFNLPAEAAHLPQGVDGEGSPGTNSLDEIGYSPPCPPPGASAHRYVFTLYALSADRLGLDDSARREAVENAFEDHLLAQTQLVGMYARPSH